MRFALTAAILVLALSSPVFAEKIAPGMKFKAVKAVLEKHGYEVNARKYGGRWLRTTKILYSTSAQSMRISRSSLATTVATTPL